MKNLKRILLPAILAIGMAACSESDGPVTLSENEVNIDMNGGTGTFTVEAPGDWYIETDGQTWYTVSPMQGSGTTEVTVTITSSEEVAPRAAVITVYGSGSSVATVAITQTGTENPENPANQTFSIRAAGETREIVLPENDGYEVVIPDGAGWISVAEKKEFSIVLGISENTGTDQYRSAEVTVNNSDGSLLATLDITQSWRNVEPGELLFEEIFITSNLIAETGKVDTRNMEQYFKLTNNTDQTLDIGGIAIAESEITSKNQAMMNIVWNPDRRNEVAAIGCMYVIPKESGKHLLEPGESVLIANNAQNYRSSNPTSFDLTGADFEWYNESTVTSIMDVDNPDVPNLEVWISGSMTIFILNSQMNSGYVLASVPSGMTAEQFASSEDYLWSGDRQWQNTAGRDFSAKFNYDAIPNDWIIDAVVVSTQEEYVYNPFCDALDAGFTYCATNGDDTGRYGKSMQRKKNSDGTLVDTNNSTNDFNHAVTASLAN